MQSPMYVERLTDTEIELAISHLVLIAAIEDRVDRMTMGRAFLIRHQDVLLEAFQELRADRAAIRRFVEDFEIGSADFVSVDRLAQAVRSPRAGGALMIVVQRGLSGLGVTGHASPYRGLTDVWLTPPELLAALGTFDLDPCAATEQPWRTATLEWTEADDGLAREWPKSARCWVNPPYGPETVLWLSKLADHGNGIALTFARTETKMFFGQVWGRADALLFIRDRLYFHRPDGERAPANSGGPSVLIGYGLANADCLATCGIPGALVRNWAVR